MTSNLKDYGVATTTTTAVLIIALAGSLLFFWIPSNNDWLYVQQGYRTWARITANEWVWILVTNSLLVCLLAGGGGSLTVLSIHNNLTTARRSWAFFLALQVMWYGVAIGSGSRHPSWVCWLGAKAAWPALWNMALVLFPSHIPKRWHVWSAHAVVGWGLVHTVLLSWHYYVQTSHRQWNVWLKLMTPFANFSTTYTEGDVNFAGWVSMACFTVVLGMSWYYSRRSQRGNSNHDSFYTWHLVLGGMGVLFAHMHDCATFFFVAPALVAATLEVCWRRFHRVGVQFGGTAMDATATVLDGLFVACQSDNKGDSSSVLTLTRVESCPVVEMCFPLPPSWRGRPLEPGSFVYLSRGHEKMTLGPPSHPFTISSSTQDTFTIHMKALGDWTTRLVGQLCTMSRHPDETNHEREFPELLLEGPCKATPMALPTFQHRIFLAAGVGLAGIARHVSSSQDDIVVWWVRTNAEYRVLKGLLDRFMNVHTFITATQDETEEDEARLSTDRLRFRYTNVSAPSLLVPVLQKHVYLLSAVLGMVLSLLLSRTICHNQPFEEDGQRYHHCSFLVWKQECHVCDVAGEGCCSSLICYYCFRGTSILLCLPVTVLSTRWLPLLFETLLRWCLLVFATWSPNRHHFVSTEESDDNTINVPIRSECETPSLLAADPNRQSRHLLEQRRGNVADVLEQHLQSPSTAIVACGPLAFINTITDEAQRIEPQARVFGLHGYDW